MNAASQKERESMKCKTPLECFGGSHKRGCPDEKIDRMTQLTIRQLMSRQPKNRTMKESLDDDADSTHIVDVVVPGAGTNIDMDLFKAAGAYSDSSGCVVSTGDRHHRWLVRSQLDAENMKIRLEIVLRSLDKLNGRDLGSKVVIIEKTRREK